MTEPTWQRSALTFAIALIGALFTYNLSFPAPFITGPAMAVTLAGLLGVKTAALPMSLRNVVYVVLGLGIGQGVTPDVFDAMRIWPLTLAVLALSVFGIIFFTYRVLMRVWLMDRRTALLASSPGHLSYVLGLTEGVDADLKMVSIVQSIRVLALTLLVPVVVTLTDHVPVSALHQPLQTPGEELALLLVVAAICGFVFRLLRLPAAYLLGGMLVSVASHATGFVGGVLPFWIAAAAYVSLGALIGSRFSGVSMVQLRLAFGAGLFVTVLAVVLAGLGALIAHWITGINLVAILIAFAPGGLETMAAMSVILGIDPTFVATHHVVRLLMLTIVVPFFVLRQDRGTDPD